MARERKRRRRARLKREAKRIPRRCGSNTTCLTDLPICIMESIVSLLPLRDAVNIALVSPQWRNLSRSTLTRRNLELSQFIWGSSKKERNLLAAARRRLGAYLKQYKGDKIDSFKFDSNVERMCQKSWTMLKQCISWVMTKGVDELHVQNSLYRMDFPPCALVSSSTKLKRLLMTKYNLLNIRTGFGGFKLLTTLSVYDAHVDQSLMENLFYVCPLLESLTLNECEIQGRGRRLSIVAGDRLTELKLLKSKVPHEFHCGAEITALNLTTLEYIPTWCNGESLSMTTPLLARMFYRYLRCARPYERDPCSPLIQFASCAGLETLHLQMESDLPRPISVPTFANLKQLRVDVEQVFIRDKYFKDNNYAIYMLDLLEAAPLLEDLVISLHITCYPVFKPGKRTMITNDNLKTVKMYGFQGNWYEIELAARILETSPKLERMVIDTDNLVNIYAGDGKFKPLIVTQPNLDCRADIVVAQEKLKDVKTAAHIIFRVHL